MLDKSIKKPLYIQLFETLSEQIQEEMNSDDSLPTEKEICNQYLVSRTTVRLAMNELEKEGIIYRIQGKGSFVATKKIDRHQSILSIDLKKHYDGIDILDIETDFLSCSFESQSFSLSQQMNVSLNTEIISIQVLHRLRDIPVAIETILLNPNYFQNFNKDDLIISDLDNLFKIYQLVIQSVEENYTISTAVKKEQKLLQINTNSLLLRILKKFYSTQNEVILICDRKILTNQFPYKNFISL